jgi:HTH-type transcriptional regulator / antitoxin HigA
VLVGDIKSDSDYRLALREIERLMTAKSDSSEGERLDVLVAQVEAWEERKHYPLLKPD